MKRLTTIIFMLYYSLSFAQTNDMILKGTVTDHEGQPLPGATVRIKGAQYGTVTDKDGQYLLRGYWKSGDVILFSFIGMKTVSFKYTGQTVQDAAMQEDSRALGEVVVKARPNINEIDLRAKAGVVQTVDVKRLNDKPMIDMSMALQGSVPGLIVTNTGDLGSKPKIRIRGNSSFRAGDAANEPLYVLDGKVISSDAFMTLNPMDIKEMKVLKDAAACALYGIKAANGVIEITSQRGNPDGETTVNYSFNMGVTTRGRRGIEMMDTEEKLELERLLQNEAAPGYRYSEDYYRRYYANDPQLAEMIAGGKHILDSLRQYNTDWFRELIRISTYQSHNLSLRSGKDGSSYYLSANYSRQGGRVAGNDVQRFTAHLSFDQQIGKIGYLSLGAEAGYSETNTPNGSNTSPTELIYVLNPYETKQGTLVSYSNTAADYTYNDLLHQYSENSTDKRGSLSGSLNLEPVNGLLIDGVGGIDVVLNEGLNFTPSTSVTERNSGVPESERGIITKNKNVTTNITSNLRLTYNRLFNEKHDLTIGGNIDFYKTDVDNVSITGYGVGTHNTPAAINTSISGNRKPQTGSFKEKTAQIGLGAVAGYSYNSTYDLFMTYKADASSILPKDKRWNSAWAVGIGWTPTRYPWLENSRILTHLNLKASYGHTASLAGVSAGSTVGTFTYSTDYYADQRLMYMIELYNHQLKPEQTVSTDFSISAEFFNRLTLDANLYRRETSQALLDVPIPLSNGFTTLKRNIGVLRNDGIEISAHARILSNDNYSLSLRTSLAYNRNKVVDLYYTDRLYTSGEAIVPDYIIGEAYDLVYGLKSLGINPITGLPVFQSKNGEEMEASTTPTRDDIFVLGHSTPPYSGIINLSASYKSFEIDMDFYYVLGGVKAYDYSYVRYADNAIKNAVKGQTDKMWFKKGDENKEYYSPFYSASNLASLEYPNTQNVGKSDYFKMSMLSLRYRFPQRFLEENCSFIRYASIAFQASNLFMITPYKESDPETGSLSGGLQPVLTINLNLTF